MAGTGVTKLDVRVARNKLIAEGKHVSARTVREVLGTGSLSTILRLLKEIEAESGEAFGVGGMVHTELRDVVMNLHDRLQEMAQATVAKGDADAAERISAAEANLIAEQEAHAMTAVQLKEAVNDLNGLTRRYEELVQRFNEASVTIGRQEQKLDSERKIQDEHLGRIDKLEHDLDLSRSQYQHLQANAQRIMEAANKSHDAALTSVQSQVQQLTQKNHDYNSEIAILNHDNGALVAAAKTNTRELSTCREALESAKSELKNTQAMLESQKLASAAQDGQLSLLTRQLDAARAHHNDAEDRSRAHALEADRLRSVVEVQQGQIREMSAAATASKQEHDKE